MGLVYRFGESSLMFGPMAMIKWESCFQRRGNCLLCLQIDQDFVIPSIPLFLETLKATVSSSQLFQLSRVIYHPIYLEQLQL